MQYTIGDMFDVQNTFDMLMIEAMSARNDLYQMGKLISRESNELSDIQIRRERFFCFRYHLAIIKESVELLNKEILCEKYDSILSFFVNYEDIKDHILEFRQSMQNWKDILRLVRNHTYHYKDPKEYIEIMKKNCYRNMEAEIEIGETLGDIYFAFVDQLYFDIIGERYAQINQRDITEQMYSDMFGEISKFGNCVASLLDVITVGFIHYKNSIQK